MISIATMTSHYAQELQTAIAGALFQCVLVVVLRHLSQRIRRPSVLGWQLQIKDIDTFSRVCSTCDEPVEREANAESILSEPASTVTAPVSAPEGLAAAVQEVPHDIMLQPPGPTGDALGKAILEHYGVFCAPAGAWCTSIAEASATDCGSDSELEEQEGDDDDDDDELSLRMSPSVPLSGLRLLEQYGAFGAEPGSWCRFEA